MKLAKKLWIGVVALALVGMLMGILAPKAAYSIVSTLVTVVNTPAQPVRTLATDAHTAFVITRFCSWGGPPGNEADVCPLENFYTVPAGKTAVLESASSVCVLKMGTTVREFQLRFSPPGGGYAQVSVPPTPGIPSPTIGAAVSTTGNNLKSYASGGASGTPISYFGFASDDQFVLTPGFFCGVTISGYLVSTP